MIGIGHRRSSAPTSLLIDGPRHLVDIGALIAGGQLTSKAFKGTIYASAEVKEVLWRLQHQKCCFCERPGERSFWTIEHFRPKTRANRGNGVIEVGYWWLAYDFMNLFFACQQCNTPKGDWFPLVAGTAALAAGQHPDRHAESPMILDPAREDPELHLTFTRLPRKGFVIAALTDRGRATIEAAHLDRDDLSALRNKHYELHLEPVVARFHEARRRSDKEEETKALKQARRLAKPDCPFALLARAAFRDAAML